MGVDRRDQEIPYFLSKRPKRNVVLIDPERVKRFYSNGRYEWNLRTRQQMMLWREARSDNPDVQDLARDKIWRRNALRKVD